MPYQKSKRTAAHVVQAHQSIKSIGLSQIKCTAHKKIFLFFLSTFPLVKVFLLTVANNLEALNEWDESSVSLLSSHKFKLCPL